MLTHIDKLKSGENLSEDTMTQIMTRIMAGDVRADHLEDFLIALSEKGETADEITGAARVLRSQALTLKAPYDAVDCCGTGGDAQGAHGGTYNISTAVALVAAACGVPMAKHGNRAASSKSGTADVLEALGVNLDMPIPALEGALEEFRFAFLMAPHHHSAMKHVADARKAIGQKTGGRTIFNLLGPLANPAGTQLQLIGVFDKKWLKPMAEALHRLGTSRAWLVHGTDGLDEITVTGKTHIVTLNEEGNMEEKTLSPDDFGLQTHDISALKGGAPEDNARALRALLEGQKGAYRDIVLANAAAALVIHGTAADLKDGVRRGAEALDSGMAMEVLTDYITLSRHMQDDSAHG